MEKRRICCFCESWESGGIESFLSNVISDLDMEKYSIDIVVSDLRESVFRTGLEEKGVRFIELSGSMQNVLKNRKLFKALLKDRNYDAVHFNFFQALSFNYLSLAKKHAVPLCIAHSHNSQLRKSLLRPVKLLLHYISRALWSKCADVRWACSGQAARFLFGKRAEYRFIPNGIDTALFAFDSAARENIRAKLGLKDSFIAGCVGRLCYQKNQMFTLDVLSELIKLRDDAVLLLVGEGEDEEALKARAKELGIEDKVIFYGVSREVQKLYSAMDVLLFPSRFEGLGIVSIEAQASGLGVICSENVPPEASVTELSRTVPLSKKAEVWAKKCANIQCKDREKYSSFVKAAGFDIAAVSKEIDKVYSGT